MAAESTYSSPKGAPAGGRKGVVERAWDVQHRLEHRAKRLGSGRYARVLKMARKPEPQEYRQALLIVAIGLGLIGFIGFTIWLLMGWLWSFLGIT
jgi:protein transport protein SEC61 subunit gamma and related proteins